MANSGLTLFTEIIYGLSGISGLATNFLIVYIILFCLKTDKTRKLITTRCILHLALADLVVVIFIPFLISDLRYKTWPYSEFTCSLLNLALLTTHFTKSFLLIFLGLTTLAIFKGQVLDLNQFKVSLIIAICWFFSLAIAFFLVINGEQRGRCNLFWHDDFFSYREAFTLMYTILVYLAPVIVLFLLIREKQLNILLDEQQLKIKQTLNLVLVMLITHFILNSFHIISQWIFTFDVEYDLSIRGYSIDANRMWKTNLFCISSWLLYSELFIFPVIYYRFCRKFGLGFEDLLDSFSENGAHLQNYLQEFRESNRIGQIYYKPVALYDKMKTNIKNSMHS